MSWIGTAYEIDIIEENQELINTLKNESIGEIDEKDKKYIVYNNKESLAFYPEAFIEENVFFNDYIRYFGNKNFEEEFTVFGTNNSIYEGDYRTEVEKYKTITTRNNIVGLDLDFNNISVKLLNTLQRQSKKIRHVAKLYILMLLSTATECNVDKHGNSTFNFSIRKGEEIVTKDVSLNNPDDSDYDLLFSIYDWILLEDSYEYAYNQKIDIVREQLFRSNYVYSEQILSTSKSIFQRLIRQETDRYFEEIGKLKDDFFKLTVSENEVYQSLHLKLLGWLSALALLLFDEIKDYSGDDLFYDLFLKNSDKISVLLFLLVGALLFILCVYILEMNMLKRTYQKMKEFYVQEMMFDESDFNNRVTFPKINVIYIIGCVFLIIILLLRVFLPLIIIPLLKFLLLLFKFINVFK